MVYKDHTSWCRICFLFMTNCREHLFFFLVFKLNFLLASLYYLIHHSNSIEHMVYAYDYRPVSASFTRNGTDSLRAGQIEGLPSSRLPWRGSDCFLVPTANKFPNLLSNCFDGWKRWGWLIGQNCNTQTLKTCWAVICCRDFIWDHFHNQVIIASKLK